MHFNLRAMLLFLVTNMDVEFERWRCRPMAQRQRPTRNWLRVGPILIVLSKLLLLSTGIQKNSLVHLRRVSSLNLCRITVVKVQNIYKKIFTIISSSIFFLSIKTTKRMTGISDRSWWLDAIGKSSWYIVCNPRPLAVGRGTWTETNFCAGCCTSSFGLIAWYTFRAERRVVRETFLT